MVKKKKTYDRGQEEEKVIIIMERKIHHIKLNPNLGVDMCAKIKLLPKNCNKTTTKMPEKNSRFDGFYLVESCCC